MSKNNRKKGKVRGNVDLHSDNESVNDMASVYSNGSYDDDYNHSNEDSIVTTTEKYEEKLLQSIENATEKSAQTRTQALQAICEILQHRHMTDFVDDRKITLMDIVEKSLRRGKGVEQEWAARLAPLLIIQLGGEDEVCSTLSQILLTTLQNRASSFSVRAAACNALGLMHFLNRSMNNLIGLLQSPHVELRMACSEIIAVILECGRLVEEDFMDMYLSDLIEVTTALAKDSQKFRNKKERKTQRASFRDVLRYLEEDITPEIQVRFGKEILDLDTWSVNIQYEKLCDITGPGITTHLTENEFLRDILQLGAKIVERNGVALNKQSKLERHLVNAAAFKARTLSLRKNRDKRSAVFN